MIRYLHGVAYAILPALIPTPKPLEAPREPTMIERAAIAHGNAVDMHFEAVQKADAAMAFLAAAEVLMETTGQHLDEWLRRGGFMPDPSEETSHV